MSEGLRPTGDDAPQIPSKRGYRHRPKPDPNAPERPYSAYVLFSNHTRDQLKDQPLSFTELSRQVGERWQALSTEEKEHWKQKAAIPWEKYKVDLAQYQKTERYQDYQRYFSDFKAREGRKNPERKYNSTYQRSSTKRPGFARESSSASAKFGSMRRQVEVAGSNVGEFERIASKVLIKRLKKEPGESQIRTETTRATRIRQACEPCRQKKIKCHGEQPICRHCNEVGADCWYESNKRHIKTTYEEEFCMKLGKG